MGNSTSSGRGHHDETVDHGYLTPQGIYTGPRDWNQAVVTQLICARRLAPFYRPLDDYNESWDDDQILAARKEIPVPESDETSTRNEVTVSSHSSMRSSHSKRPGSLKEPSKPEAAVYRGAVECPICFLYYPPNINHSRCCDQAICTECFVQIKRSEPTTTHIVSEPAACPYCVQENFGIVYSPPLWRAGIGSDGMTSMWPDATKASHDSASPYPTHKRRQKSFGADSPEVVTTDQIRPDWEAKLAAVRAAVTRRANRRIIMRQVGDRLIPVGITSGRVHALSPEEAAAEGVDNNGSRRSRRRQQPPNQNLEQFLGMGGQDLEELMLMEAMRLSMIDHEEHQRREAEEKKKQAAAQAESEAATAGGETLSGAGPSTLDIPAPSSDHTPSPVSSSSSSSSPVPVPHAPNTKRNSLLASLSRSRTPPANTLSASLPGSDGISSSWRRRSPSPNPYSTLNAALSTVSTANAILGSSSEHNTASEANGATIRTTSGSIPSITVGSDDGSHSAANEEQSSSQRPKIILHDSTSVISTDTTKDPSSSYDNLPSSPESGIAYEPLLGSKTTSNEHA